MRIFFCFFCGLFLFLSGCRTAPQDARMPDAPAQEEQTVILPTVPVLPLSSDEIMQTDNTAYGWGFRRMLPDPPEFTDGQVDMMAQYHCLYRGDPDKPYLYLTFDEGYENGYTDDILDVLRKTGTPAAFFITGSYFMYSRELVDQMVRDGHIVGNHTMHHENLPALCASALPEEEFLSLDRAFFDAYQKPMLYFRPPEGEYSERMLALSGSLGYKTAFWSLAYADWDKKAQKGKAYAYDQVMKNLHNGAVILLHAVSKDNADALEDIICDARILGYSFRSLDEYEP